MVFSSNKMTTTMALASIALVTVIILTLGMLCLLMPSNKKRECRIRPAQMEFWLPCNQKDAAMTLKEDRRMYHCVWFGRANPLLLLCLNSLFATQRGRPIKVILWTDAQSVEGMQQFTAQCSGPVTVRVPDTWLREHPGCKNSLAFRSDSWRVQILYRYGGIYFDLDVLFLRDMSCWDDRVAWVQEGYQAWGCFNNAIMHFPRWHPALFHWMDAMFRSPTLDWEFVKHYHKYTNPVLVSCHVKMVSNSLLDCGWVESAPSSTFDDFFAATSRPHLLTTSLSYAYHWHNRWAKQIEPGSIAHFYWRKFIGTV